MAVFSGIGSVLSLTAIGGLFAKGTIAGFILRAAASAGLSRLAQKLSGRDVNQSRMAVKGQLQRGADVPQSIIFGNAATAGSLVYANTWGNSGDTPNAFLTMVISLSDMPIQSLDGIWVNGVKYTIGTTADPNLGFPVEEFAYQGTNWLYVKFHDGTQTTADSFLTTYVSSAERPWNANAVGAGTAYAIVTARVHPTLWKGSFPQFLFEVTGVPLYDITKDSTAGGSGTHRWANPATWGGDGDANPAVQIYNLLRGITWGGDWVYGLQNVSAAQLPAADWIAVIDKCRATIASQVGSEPTFRASGEVPLDAPVSEALDALLDACNGRLGEAGGVYKLYAGGVGVTVATFSDDDILSTEEQSFTPFFGLADTINGVNATYPAPAAAWQTETAPPITDAGFEVEDGGRRLMVDAAFDMVPYPEQVQRLMRWALREARRARRHTITLPPEFWPLEPGDVVSWTSERNGYVGKRFRVDGLSDLPNADVVLDLTEVNTTDYDYDTNTDFTPVADPGVLEQLVPPQQVQSFSVSATSIPDAFGTGRRPAIQVNWNGAVDDVAAIKVQVRVAATGALIYAARYDDIDGGVALISGAAILANTEYEVRGKYIPASARDAEWTVWLSVTTLDLRLTSADFDEDAIEWSNLGQDVKDQIDSAGDAAASALIAQTARDFAVAVETRETFRDGLTNPGFEAGTNGATGVPGGWIGAAQQAGVFGDGKLAYRDGVLANTAGAAASLVAWGSIAADAGPWWYLSKLVRATDGQQFDIAAAVRLASVTTGATYQSAGDSCIGVNDVYLHVRWLNADGTFLSDSVAPSAGYDNAAGNSWGDPPAATYFAYAPAQVTAPAGAAYAEIRLIAADGGGVAVSAALRKDYSGYSGHADVILDDVAVASPNGDVIEAFEDFEASKHRAAAGISESLASIAKTDAEDAAAGAIFARGVAARMYNGSAFPNPIWADWDNTYPDAIHDAFEDSGAAITKDTTGAYGNAVKLDTGSALTANRPYFRIRSSDAEIDLPDDDNCIGLNVDMEVEKLSGLSWGGACLRLVWVPGGTGGTTASVNIFFNDAMNGTQGRQTLSVDVLRPGSFVAGSLPGYVDVLVYGTSDFGGKARSQNVTRIHRLNIRNLTAEATAYLHQSALTDLQGNALASLVLRAKAGGAVGEVEVVAAHDPVNGTKSFVRLKADSIGLDGETIAYGSIVSSNYAESGGIPTAGFSIGIDGTIKAVRVISSEAVKTNAISRVRISSAAAPSIVWTPSISGEYTAILYGQVSVSAAGAATESLYIRENGVDKGGPIQAKKDDTSPDVLTVYARSTTVWRGTTVEGVPITIATSGNGANCRLVVIETKR